MPECFAKRAPARCADRAQSGIQPYDYNTAYWIPAKGTRE
jgi:hypothetical protein